MKKGISLAVLVVTIIVLVILTAATVTTISGQNGVIDEARLAASDTQKQNAKDKLYMEISAAQIRAAKENTDLYTYLTTHAADYAGTALELQPNDDDTSMKFLVDGYTILVDNNGNITVDGEENPNTPTPQDNPGTNPQSTGYIVTLSGEMDPEAMTKYSIDGGTTWNSYNLALNIPIANVTSIMFKHISAPTGDPTLVKVGTTNGGSEIMSCVIDENKTSSVYAITQDTTIYLSFETPSQIQFTVDGKTYYADNGMTWYEWIDSAYNTDGYAIWRSCDTSTTYIGKYISGGTYDYYASGAGAVTHACYVFGSFAKVKSIHTVSNWGTGDYILYGSTITSTEVIEKAPM